MNGTPPQNQDGQQREGGNESRTQDMTEQQDGQNGGQPDLPGNVPNLNTPPRGPLRDGYLKRTVEAPFTSGEDEDSSEETDHEQAERIREQRSQRRMRQEVELAERAKSAPEKKTVETRSSLNKPITKLYGPTESKAAKECLSK